MISKMAQDSTSQLEAPVRVRMSARIHADEPLNLTASSRNIYTKQKLNLIKKPQQ